MRFPQILAMLTIASVISCAPTPRRIVASTRPSISATAYEALQAKQERERDDAALAAESTQKQLDALRKEVDELKQRETAAKLLPAPPSATTYREQIRQQTLPEKPITVPTADPNAKAIDAEVAGILSGEHGHLPPAQKTRSNSSGIATIRVTNDTASTLTVLYSGSTSKKSVLPPHQSETVSLSPGP